MADLYLDKQPDSLCPLLSHSVRSPLIEAYYGPITAAWPAQNLVCMCLAIGVARAVQLQRLSAVILALIALVIYDLVAVESSAMTAVALSKVPLVTASASSGMTTSGGDSAVTIPRNWQPGALEVVLSGRVSDVLGLGDAVFPSILSTWALRFDNGRTTKDGRWGYFSASLVGFSLGCFACEIGPGASSGQPALLYLVPCMLVTVLGVALVRGELGVLWSFRSDSN